MRGRFGRSGRVGDPTGADGPLDSLLEEMRDLRLTLAADLNAAAGAADAGAENVVAEIVDADRVELARFARVADQRLARLQRLATAQPDTPRWRRRVVVALPVVPVVGALALSAAAATGVLPLPSGSGDHSRPEAVVSATPSTVDSSFARFVDVLGAHPSASQVIAAASKLHHQIRELMAASPNDPSKAAQVAELLRMEQSLLMRAQPPGAQVVLSATRKLAARLVSVVPVSASPTDVPNLETFDGHHHDRKSDTASASPSPSPTKSTESPKPTSSPSSSPSSSSSPDPSGPLPHLPNG